PSSVHCVRTARATVASAIDADPLAVIVPVTWSSAPGGPRHWKSGLSARSDGKCGWCSSTRSGGPVSLDSCAIAELQRGGPDPALVGQVPVLQDPVTAGRPHGAQGENDRKSVV